MSGGLGRAAAPILATVCGVCTAYATFAPELQKQQMEREGKNMQNFQDQHAEGIIPPTKTEQQAEIQPPNQTAIDNDASIGASVKDAIAEAKTEVVPNKAWWGLSMFSGVLGGKESAKDKSNDEKRS